MIFAPSNLQTYTLLRTSFCRSCHNNVHFVACDKSTSATQCLMTEKPLYLKTSSHGCYNWNKNAGSDTDLMPAKQIIPFILKRDYDPTKGVLGDSHQFLLLPAIPVVMSQCSGLPSLYLPMSEFCGWSNAYIDSGSKPSSNLSKAISMIWMRPRHWETNTAHYHFEINQCGSLDETNRTSLIRNSFVRTCLKRKGKKKT